MVMETPEYPGDEVVRELSDRHLPQTEALLESLIRIPSLSLPGSSREVLVHSADTLRDAFNPVVPWDQIQVVSANGGAPALIARKHPAPGMLTVLLYAHHDVQPPGDESAWLSPPFEPMRRDGRLYGRGSADDGAGIVTHYHALSVLAQSLEGSGGLGIVLFIEGEEESGSPTFDRLLEEHRELLTADVIVVADSDNPSALTPALTTSLRGVVGVRVTLRALNHSVHSGMFGGPIPDALTSLIRLLGTVQDEAGAVAIAGLDVDAPGGLAEVSEQQLRHDAGLLPGVPLWGEGELSERLWWQPSITVTGIDAPATDRAANTLLAEASAKISLRIPPGVAPARAKELLEAHLRSHTPAGVALECDHWEMGEGFSQSADLPLVQSVVSALRDGFGAEVEYQGVGGSIPFVASLQRAFPEAAIAITGVEDRQSAAHGPNESVDLGMLSRAAYSEALLMVRLACGV